MKTRKYTNSYTQIKIVLCIVYIILCAVSCTNLPDKATKPTTNAEVSVIWDLGVSASSGSESFHQDIKEGATPTPQLISAIDFNAAFNAPLHTAQQNQEVPYNTYQNADSIDSAAWQYFYPADYSTGEIQSFSVALKNTGEKVWNYAYRLVHFSGDNPTGKETIALNNVTSPNEELRLDIPVTSSAADWHSCWQLQDENGQGIYDFCYNHGTGVSAPSSSGKSAESNAAQNNNDGVFWAFVQTKANSPAFETSGEWSASGAVLSPSDDHTFCAYDHTEMLTATFTNTGTETWDERVALIFYNGYNWMHTDSYSVSHEVAPGESVTFNMPMEIFEDNDNWQTCWYLASPNGLTMNYFCFKYHTRGC